MVERKQARLRFPGEPPEIKSGRPAINVYLEYDAPATCVGICAGVEIDEWEIGRKIIDAGGTLRLTKERLWRRIGATEWRSDSDPSDGPSDAQVRRGRLEPHRDRIGDMLAEARSLYPDWAALMRSWELTHVKDARGGKRVFDSADVARRPDEDNDSWVAARLEREHDGEIEVHWQTPAKRRWVDRRNALGAVPWAITPERLNEMRASDEPSPGAIVKCDPESEDG